MHYAAMQTPLDLMIMDNIRVWVFSTVSFMLIFFLGTLYGKLGYNPALILFSITIFSAHLITASMTVTLLVKSILVFKSHWLDEISDQTLLKTSRVASLFYSTFLYSINLIWYRPVDEPVLNTLTEVDEPTSFGQLTSTGF